MTHWRPTASRAMLEQRALLLARTRRFFAEGGVLEVDTPIVVNSPVTDIHIHSAQVNLGPAAEHGYFLHTSPEYAMKRLLAAGSGDIYQICHVVRGFERGRLHNAEFTLIEWYRLRFTLDDLMSEVDALVRALLGPVAAGRVSERITYREAFLRELQLDPFTASMAELQQAAAKLGFNSGGTSDSSATSSRDSAAPSSAATPRFATTQAAPRGDDSDAAPASAAAATTPARSAATPGRNSVATPTSDSTAPGRDELLDLLMAAIVGPRLGTNALTFVHAYPATQAALARLDPHDPRAALRFELYCDGIELANGFHELSSPTEQRARFNQDNADRARMGLPVHPPDEFLLAALEAGLPECSGVALGFDRTVMLATDAKTIDEVLAFPTEQA